MFSWKKVKKFPIIVAHRGESAKAPENTMTAFRMAVKEGADAIELDVHLTRDKQIVVIHDDKIDRTTDGKGFVCNYSLSQLKNFDATTLWNKKFPTEPVPALDNVLSEFGDTIGINIEIKKERTLTGQYDLIMKCIELVSKYKLSESILFSSFSIKVIEKIGELDFNIPRGLLYDPLMHSLKSPISIAKSIGAKYLIMNHRVLTKKIVRSVHDNDMLIGGFTVNTIRQADRLLRYGIDMIITNHVSHILTNIR